jgi:protein ImuA
MLADGIESRRDLVRALEARVRRWESARRPAGKPVTTGSPVLDRLLPNHGLNRGGLVEWLCDGVGSGATTLALFTARAACGERGVLVVIDPEQSFYPLAAAGWGIVLDNTIVVRPKDTRDHHWAWDQALACSGVSAVLGWPETIPARTFRRWQLAAERGGTLGLLMRPATARGSPTWSDVQWDVQPLPTPAAEDDVSRRLRVELVRCRGGSPGATVDLIVDAERGEIHDAHPLYLAPELAAGASRSRAIGA